MIGSNQCSGVLDRLCLKLSVVTLTRVRIGDLLC